MIITTCVLKKKRNNNNKRELKKLYIFTALKVAVLITLLVLINSNEYKSENVEY